MGLSYNSRTNDRIVVKLMHKADIDATVKLTQGQGHKVKCQRLSQNEGHSKTINMYERLMWAHFLPYVS